MKLRSSLSHEAAKTCTVSFKIRLNRLLAEKGIAKILKLEPELYLCMFTSQVLLDWYEKEDCCVFALFHRVPPKN